MLLLIPPATDASLWRQLAYWADIASILALATGLIGFVVTIWNVRRSRDAANQAEAAAQEARDSILTFDTIQELSAATTTMDEIKRLHRAGYWTVLPDRYTSVRRLLGSILAGNPGLSDEGKSVLVGAIKQLGDIERLVERGLATDSNPGEVPKLNEIISKQADKLNSLLVALRMETPARNTGYARQQDGGTH